MTTIFTRQYAEESEAQSVQYTLRRKRVPGHAMQVLAKRDGEDEDRLKKRLEMAHVHKSAIGPYAKGMMDGNAILVVRATYKPLGAVKLVRTILGDSPAIATGKEVDEFETKDDLEAVPSILRDHPRFLTIGSATVSRGAGPVTSSFGFKTLSAHRQSNSAISGGRYMSRMFWPMKLVSKDRHASSAMSGGGHMSTKFWPMPLISNKSRRPSVIEGGGQPLSEALGWPTIS